MTDPVPSTFDYSYLSKEDGVLQTLRNARERYVEGAIRGTYVAGGVCAIGALIKEDKNTRNISWADGDIVLDSPHTLEQDAKEATKEAIRLLNSAAVSLYPWTEANIHEYCYGPIEDLNESSNLRNLATGKMPEVPGGTPLGGEKERLRKWEEHIKPAVLRCYDEAIKSREEALREVIPQQETVNDECVGNHVPVSV